MERLSSLDGVFLAAEDDRNHMNIGTLAIFAGPAPPLTEIRAFLAARLSRVPRCRQRVHEPTGPLGRPVWVDDDGFDIDRHVRAVDRAGGSPPDLDALVADLLARPLDRSRPLWEVWVVSDGPDEQWALIAKVHHCLADGIAGSDLLGAVLTTAPDPVPLSPPPWTPAPEPAAGAYLRFGVRTALRSLTARVRGALTMLRHPVRTGRRARAVARAARRLWYRQLRPVTSLTGPIGETRRWAHGALSRDEIDEIRRTLGGTVNDVVVAAVTLGLRDLLVARGEPVADRTVTAMIPVALRAPSDRGRTGNELANVHAELPVGTSDPRNVLRAVHDHIEELKRSHEVDATGLLLRIGDYTPRVLANRVVREVLHRQRSVETVITDVPGPPARLFLGDRPLLAGYPVAPIAGRVRMCVALWSYCGTLGIGVTGDRESAPDVAALARGIERGVATLLGTARDA